MNLGIFLSPGESLTQMKKSGQDQRFIESYIKPYSKHFDTVYIFSYEDENLDLPSNTFIVANKTGLHRLMYAFLLPLLHYKEIKDCNVVRGFGLASSLSSILLAKPFVFNWAYDYQEFIKLQNRTFYSLAYYVLEKIAFFKAKKIFVATKKKLATLKGTKYVYLPNGVDTNLFKASQTSGSGLVFVGRLEKQKNLFFLIDAIAALPRKERAVTFIGEGGQEKGLKEHAQAKGVFLKILPPVANRQLPKILSRFSIFTLPSFSEGSPKVLLEAMAVGLVPAVTNFDTASDVINDGINGFITTYDVKEYSEKLEFLLKDAKLAKNIQRAARQTITKNFNIDDLITKEIKITKEAAS